MTRVVRREGESFNSLLKRFRRQVSKGRVLSTVKKKRYYVSDSEQWRIALRKAVRKEKKHRRRVERRRSRT